ncbi:MAG: polysaccharide biosynthesis tyrosine autokinase [Rhodovibrionaceae bacterium]
MSFADRGGGLSPYGSLTTPAAAPAVRPGFPGPRLDAGAEDGGWELLCKLWRRKWLVLGVTLLVAVLAALAAQTMTPRYTAEARVLIGTQQPHVAEIQAVLENIVPNSDTVRTEAYVIASRKMARDVAERLSLDESPIFNPALREEEASLLEKLGLDAIVRAAKAAVTAVSGGAEEGDSQPRLSEEARRSQLWEGIESRVLSRIEVEPLNRSHVIAIAAETENPELSARMANAFAEAYTSQQLSTKESAADQVNAWLDERLQELRGQVEVAERKVEDYRKEHELFATQSDTVIGQQMAALNQGLIGAETQVAEAQARLAQAESLRGEGGDLQSVPSVLQSDLILSLRNQKAELERQAAELRSDYTDKHPKVQNIQAQLGDVDRRINAEIERIVTSLQNELDIATNNRARAQGRMEEAEGTMGESNSAEVRLRQLEREAEASRQLYESLLQRSKETAYQAGMMAPGAELVSAAAVPYGPSFPPSRLMLAVGALAGIGLGVLLALLLEKLDQTFRTPEELEETTGLPALAVLPRVPVRRSGRCDYVLQNPRSVYADALRMLGTQLSLERREHIIPNVTVFTSAAPGEGKSHTSCSYAQLMASEGKKVALLDLDWRQPTQHRLFGQRFRQTGVIDLLNGEATPQDIIHEDRNSGVHVLFTGKLSRMRGQTVSLERVQALLETLSRHYDEVVVDTSPLRVTPEVLHLARIADHVVINVKWGGTRRSTVTTEIKNLARSGAHVSGIVLSQVDPKRYKQYSYGEGAYLHHGYLAQSA